ncbi:MAG: hypothetical protein AAF226_07500, partial [Verrucomicrobiota bacterium]
VDPVYKTGTTQPEQPKGSAKTDPPASKNSADTETAQTLDSFIKQGVAKAQESSRKAEPKVELKSKPLKFGKYRRFITTVSALNRRFIRRGHKLKASPSRKTPTLFHKRASVGQRRVSQERVVRESRRFVSTLQSKGSEPRAEITFTWGEKLGSKVKGKKIIITAPNQVKPGDFRREIHKAHARIALMSLKQSHPEAFANLSLQAEESFECSKGLYSDAVLEGKDWRKKV